MAIFLIQTIKGQIKHDFSFALIEAINYQNWLMALSHSYEFCEIEDIINSPKLYGGYIPSGTVEFIKSYLECYYDIDHINPINIPTALMKNEYLKRNVSIKLKGSYKFDAEKFVKSDTIIKGFTDFTRTLTVPDDEKFLVSDVIEIDSEWRSFVFRKELVGMQNYSGDFTFMPDIDLIKKMILDYEDSPPAYTIDVGMNNNDGTFLIEVHNCYSVGTYGFSDNRYLPQMFTASFMHLSRHRF
jgi:hypothetical protein